MPHEITDTLDKDILAVVQACLYGKINSGQAMKQVRRLQRLAAVSRYQVPVTIKGVPLTDDQLDRMTRILGLEL